jgi:hypothetical protein
MTDYEKLGVFYIGRPKGEGEPAEPLLYDSKDLTTHAVCLGMTGSGKTGLGIALLEEAAIDGIPSLVVDPKGDMANLLLTFPGLSAAEFRPWIDEGEAARKGMTPDAFAEKTADTWKKGLASWDEPPERIARLRAAADFAIYTPGAKSGLPLSILSSLGAPGAELAADAAAMRDRVSSVVSGVLSLLHIEADPLQSREHILLSNIVEKEWAEGRDLSLAGLIQSVQAPPFDAVGVMPLESFFPAKDRFALAMRLNTLVASPSFAAWTEGEPMDIQRLLYTPEGKPRVCVLSIAHLPDTERMFFVTVLLNELVAWMRRQPGTSSLRALLYMDEIFGYFPPSAMPPSKRPMLTLLKQARAYGLGVILSTQNPVDLDYRGLANIGTWFIGRLQTERDKARVIEGLLTADESGNLSRSQLEAQLAGLGKRIFLMRNAHDDVATLFETRWCLSYLRGPLTPPQIAALMAPAKAAQSAAAPAPANAPVAEPAAAPVPSAPAPAARLRSGLKASVRLHYANASQKVDYWETRRFLVPCDGAGNPLWEEIGPLDDGFEAVDAAEAARAGVPVPPVGNPKHRTAYERALKAQLRYAAMLRLFALEGEKLVSRPGESRGEFTVRARQLLRDRRDEEKKKLSAKYGAKIAALQEKARKAQAKIESEKEQLSRQKMNTFLSFGTAALSVLLGRKAGGLGRATTGLGKLGQQQKERLDVAQAEATLKVVQEQLAALEAEAEAELEKVAERFDFDELPIESLDLQPKSADTLVQSLDAVCYA